MACLDTGLLVGRKHEIIGRQRLSLPDSLLARISQQLTVEARHKPAMTALRLLTVLNVLSRSGAERKSLLISEAPRCERARLHPQKYASARRAARALY